MFKNGMRAVHPGKVLREDYLLTLNMSANALAQALRVTPVVKPPEREWLEPRFGQVRKLQKLTIFVAKPSITDTSAYPWRPLCMYP